MKLYASRHRFKRSCKITFACAVLQILYDLHLSHVLVTHPSEIYLTLAPVEHYNLFDEGRDTALDLHEYVTAAFRQWNMAPLTDIRVAVLTFTSYLVSTSLKSKYIRFQSEQN